MRIHAHRTPRTNRTSRDRLAEPRVVDLLIAAAFVVSAFVAAAIVVAAPASAADLTGGVAAKFIDKPATDRDSMRASFRYESSIAAPLPDPTNSASSVTVRFRALGGGAITTVGPTALVSANWQEKRLGEDYRYRDPERTAGGVEKIGLSTSPDGGRLTISARSDGYGAAPVAGPVDWVEVSLTIGATTYCGQFSGVASEETRNDNERVSFRRGSRACGEEPIPAIRVPAEWEEQEAVWLQWPGPFEDTYEPAFAQMSVVIAGYQKLHILHDSNGIRNSARSAITAAGGDPDHANIQWHAIANDNAWMRDNGPVYVAQDGQLRIQDWKFDAWGGAFGPFVPYAADDVVPAQIASLVGMPLDAVDIVHERGNLEFNGSDTVILNWSVLGDPQRNPGYTQSLAVADMQQNFGVTRVVLLEGYVPSDLTMGHVDGIARFINPTTVVVGQCTLASLCQPGDSEAAVYDDAAARIEAAGLTVIRDPFEGKTSYNGGPEFDIDYMNWLVGNGFVIAVGFGNATTNAAAKSRLEGYYPGRTVYVIDMLASWDAGGGAHCHTNDQPAVSTTLGYSPWAP